jgi:catechol 2,3-dioxygenase-like lactoylglutathione lyase family enzyme
MISSLVVAVLVAAAAPEAPAHAIDHVGLGVSDLDRGIGFVEEKTGVQAAKGGVHPGRGTQNALMSLGGGSYLEIIAPVPGGKVEGEEGELLKLALPKPVFFAVRSTGLEATSRMLKDSGFAVTSINAGSRVRPDGTVLKWRTMGLTGPGLDAAPFFIEWDKASAHPSATSPGGCTLARLEAFDRDTAALSKLFRLLALDVLVHAGAGPALRLTLSCPKGEVIFGP